MKNYIQFIGEYIKESDMSMSWIDKLDPESYIRVWFQSITSKDIEQVKYIIKKGIDVNVVDNDDFTGLIIAAREGIKNIVELLLEQPGININHQGWRGFTALIMTMRNIFMGDHVEVAKLLLKRKEIDITLKTDDDKDFITIDKEGSKYLKDYDLQKNLLKNEREDIIILLNKHGLIDDKFKKENPYLFQAIDWGLTI